MSNANFIRGIVKKNPQLKLKLKKANSKLTPFQYVYQTITMSIFSVLAILIIVFMLFKDNFTYLGIGIFSTIFIIGPLIYKFWFSIADVQITKAGREIDSDLLFVSEYFLVSLESGLPLGNSIQNLSKLDRAGSRFMKRIYMDFKTGKDLESALEEGASYCPSDSMKVLLKRLKDSLNIGIDLRSVLENFIEESSETKLIEIRGYSKKLNPIIMMYLILGIVLPSLGVTFFILGASIMQLTPELLKYILIIIFLIMFGFQYMAYSIFKFNRATI